MGSKTSSTRAISFPAPKTLSTHPPDFVGSNDLWIYFPPVGYDSGLSYPNSGRGWWVKFDTRSDIASVRGLNGALSINFRPGQAVALNLPQNGGSVLMGTNYKVTVTNGLASMVVPYNNIVANPQSQ